MTSVDAFNRQDDGGDRLVIKKQQINTPPALRDLPTAPRLPLNNDDFYGHDAERPRDHITGKFRPRSRTDYFRALSLPGGGIQGIIALETLARIEERMGRPICDLFEVAAGTSTGGIIALALAKNGKTKQPIMSARALQNLYLEHGQEIFKKSFLGALLSLGGIATARFNAEPLKKALSAHFGDMVMGDLDTRVAVVAVDRDSAQPHYFRSRDAGSTNIKLLDAAMATSAAPFYFKNHTIVMDDGKMHKFTDGGIHKNSPVAIADGEARRLFTGDVLVTHIGNGASTPRPGLMQRLHQLSVSIWSKLWFGIKDGGYAQLPTIGGSMLNGQHTGDKAYIENYLSIDPQVDQKIPGRKTPKTGLADADRDNLDELLYRARLSLDAQEKDPNSDLSKLFRILSGPVTNDPVYGDPSPKTSYLSRVQGPHPRPEAA